MHCICACSMVVGTRALNPTVLDLAQCVDPFKEYVGWMFFRNSPWSFPIGLNPTYGLDFSPVSIGALLKNRCSHAYPKHTLVGMIGN
jgi:hypothetical protein